MTVGQKEEENAQKKGRRQQQSRLAKERHL
jgi:hypothetical protein